MCVGYTVAEQIELGFMFHNFHGWFEVFPTCLRQSYTGSLGLVYQDDPEGWYGEGGGRGVQDWEHLYTHGGFTLMYGKTNTIL